MPDISIVLLTCYGEKYLEQVLEMIRRQKPPPDEVLAIDSESTDSTLDILRKFDVTIHQIRKAEFSHSRTRNLAARLCTGRYLIFLTQDATPADNCWLDCLLRPFREHENVAGTFSRHLPRPGASLLAASDLRLEFSRDRLIKTAQFCSADFFRAIHFSNSSAAYDRSILLQHPFEEQLEMAEDQEWARRMLKLGFTLVYEPDSVVLHSHNHSLREQYQRSLKMGASFSAFLSAEMGSRSTILEIGAWANHALLDFRYLITCDAEWTDRIKWFAKSPLQRMVTHYAFRKGWNSAKPLAVSEVPEPV